MEIDIRSADLFEIESEAMVFPGTTTGDFLGPMGRRLKRLLTEEVEAEINDTAPIAVGAATVLEVEGLKAEHLIYAPVVLEVGEKIIVENVRRCTRAALVACKVREFESIVIPVIHPNSDDMSITETARAMVDELRGFKPDRPLSVMLVDRSEEVIDTLNRAIETVR